MAYEHKNNEGRVFQNFDKRGSKSPDYSGTAMIDGRVYYVSAWHNPPGESRGGEPGKGNFRLLFQDKAERDAERASQGGGGSRGGAPRPAQDDRPPLDDDIPF